MRGPVAVWLAEHHPAVLADIVRAAAADSTLLPSGELTFAAEALGGASDAAVARAALLGLLAHPSAIVREGAVLGLASCADADAVARLRRVAATDTSPAVRDVARCAADQAETP